MKVHIFVSSRPLRNGESAASRCGHLVTKARIVFAWDDMPVNTSMHLPGLSKRCADGCWDPFKKRRRGRQYAYAVIEARDAEEFREQLA